MVLAGIAVMDRSKRRHVKVLQKSLDYARLAGGFGAIEDEIATRGSMGLGFLLVMTMTILMGQRTTTW